MLTAELKDKIRVPDIRISSVGSTSGYQFKVSGLSVKVAPIESGLKETGIDIGAKKITLGANTEIVSGGKAAALLRDGKIKAEYVDHVMEAGNFIVKVTGEGLMGSRDKGATWVKIWS